MFVKMKFWDRAAIFVQQQAKTVTERRRTGKISTDILTWLSLYGCYLGSSCRSKATLTSVKHLASMQHMLSMQVLSQSQVTFPATTSGGVHHRFSVQWSVLLQALYQLFSIQ